MRDTPTLPENARWQELLDLAAEWLASDKRLLILEWLRDPKAHFPPQRDGDLVEAGQPLVVIEAMKMETTLSAESAAIVKHVRVEEGQTVDHGAVLIELSPPPASSGRESVPRDP